MGNAQQLASGSAGQVLSLSADREIVTKDFP